LQELLARLSVPSQELQDLLQQPCASNANTLRWAISKLASHAAKDQAQEAVRALGQLQQQLEAATDAVQQSQASHVQRLLQVVAAQAERTRLQHLPSDQLQQLPMYQAVAAQLR
jgi:alkyl sulfatase BDS1-like metallo-beta-lactamase superfamily hydrolase